MKMPGATTKSWSSHLKKKKKKNQPWDNPFVPYLSTSSVSVLLLVPNTVNATANATANVFPVLLAERIQYELINSLLSLLVLTHIPQLKVFAFL